MNELEQAYLAHHGILGQKWHHRNGPPYPLDAGDHSKSEKEAGYKKSLGGGRNEELYSRKTAKKATKQLNKLDKEIGYHQHERDEYDRLKKTREKSLEKAVEKGKDQKVLDKKQKALDAVNRNISRTDEAITRGKQEVNDILNSLDSGSFDINSEEVKRTVNKGEVAALTFGGLWVGGLVGGVAAGVASRDRRTGTKYKVEAKTTEERNNGQAEPTKSNADLIRKARNKDVWDLNFLEAIQNSKIDYDNNKKEMLKEYRIYLDDPEDYWKNRVDKLEPAY